MKRAAVLPDLVRARPPRRLGKLRSHAVALLIMCTACVEAGRVHTAAFVPPRTACQMLPGAGGGRRDVGLSGGVCGLTAVEKSSQNARILKGASEIAAARILRAESVYRPGARERGGVVRWEGS